MAFVLESGTIAVAVTPSDTVDIAVPDAPVSSRVSGGGAIIRIGAAGSCAVQPYGNALADTVVFVGCYAGEILPVRVKKVLSTGTSATDILAIW